MGRLVVLMLVLSAAACGEAEIAPWVRDCRVPVFFTPEAPVAYAAVVGGFNAWDERRDPLSDPDGDGTYTGWLELPPGSHRYRLFGDGVAHLDARNPLTLFDPTGKEQSVFYVPECDKPEWVLESLTVDDGELAAAWRFWAVAETAPLDADSVTVSLDDGTTVALSVDAGRVSVVASGLLAGKTWLRVSAEDRNGVGAEPWSAPVWTDTFTWQDAVFYQIVVDRFRRGQGELARGQPISFYHGGDLYGVVAAIKEGYFADLGVNALWVSPLYDNPEGAHRGRDGHLAEAYHGYWPVNPRAVEDRFGGEVGLRELVRVAHDHGLRVVMDAVLNHVHRDHPYVGAYPSRPWFNHPEGDCLCGFSCSWAQHIGECWFDPFLPDLNWQHEPVVEQMVADALAWLRSFDLDGLRLDAVPMMPRLAMRRLRHRVATELEVAGTDIYLLGENYTGRGGQAQIRYYLGEKTLSGLFDFPTMWALRDALAGRVPMVELEAEVTASHAAWHGSGAVMAPILGNHDVPRLISDLNGDPLGQPRNAPPAAPETDKAYALAAMAWTFLLTQPGAPVIYYGDEFGMPGANDPDNRRPMRFSPDLSSREATLLAHVQALGGARRCATALRRDRMRTLLLNENLYVYGRDAGDGFPAVVVLNRATVSRNLKVTLPAEWQIEAGAAFFDVLGRTTATAGDPTLSISVPPRTSALLLTDPRCD